jgi:hypothetical protein
MALADYELLAARSFEEPYDADLRASVLVCADALSQEGDPRGPLIAMEHALRDADHARAIELRKAMHEHAATEASALLGSAASLMSAHRTLELDWRSGKLYGMTVDARYRPGASKVSVGAFVKQAIGAPAAADLRRLRVRIRTAEERRSIVDMLAAYHRPPPLEELVLYTTVWPQRMLRTPQLVLQERYPHLYYVVYETRTQSLPPRGMLLHDPADYLPDVAQCDPPVTPSARAFLGRCLTNGHRELRLAALARIQQLGPQAKVYEQVLSTLLQPGVATDPTESSAPLLPIALALVAVRPSRATRRMLDRIASRPESYDAAVRSVAGKATELDRR